MSLTTCLSNEVALLIIHPSIHPSQFCVHALGKAVAKNCGLSKMDKARQCHLHREKKLITWNEAVVLFENFQPNWDLQVMEFMPAARFVEKGTLFFPPNLRQVSQKMMQVLERKISMNST